MTVTWEYEPDKENYDEGMTIEDMAKSDASHPEIHYLIKEEGSYSDVKWKIIEKPQ